MPPDPHRKKKIRSLSETVERAQKYAFLRVSRAGRPGNQEYDIPWNERTVGYMSNMKLAEGLMAVERAKAAARVGTTAVFGVVAVVPKIEDPDAWERMHRRIEAGEKIIDVEEAPALEAAEDEDGTDP